MRSLAKYFYRIIKNEYDEWHEKSHGKGIPGRLILKEFDLNLVKEILKNIVDLNEFPLSNIGDEEGVIIAVEDHLHYEDIQNNKCSFAELAHERNREGNFFCLMFVAEVKPTLEQVSGVDQSAVFELSEIKKWVDIARHEKPDSGTFLPDYVDDLAKFISELTNPKWNNRPFIEIDKINDFIEGVITDTIKNGLFWSALGKNCTHLGGINRLNEFCPLQTAGSTYRRTFRAIVAKSLFVDIEFWRAIYKNKEIEFSEISLNLEQILKSNNDYSEFCQKIESYFKSFFINDRELSKKIKHEIQLSFDSENPYSSVLQAKNTKPKFLLGEETINFLSDNDIKLETEFKELLELVDIPSQKPEINDLRKFYFLYSKDISENSKLDKAWLKEISNSKPIECGDFIEGLLSVLSKSVLVNDIGQDTICLELSKDRRRKSLEKKNWFALNFFNNEYKDLKHFWSQFGDNFKIDFGQVFDENFADSVENKYRKERDGKAANELSFRVVRYNENDDSPSVSWELKWIFNPYGIEAAKYLDFNKLLDRKGFFHHHEISLDPLYIKRADSTPTIDNSHMFLAVSAKNMKKGAVVKKSDKELNQFFLSLNKLRHHQFISDDDYQSITHKYEIFVSDWRSFVEKILNEPICAQLNGLEKSFTDLSSLLMSLTSGTKQMKELMYELLKSHTISVTDNNNYAVYLPWSPFSLLMQSSKNKTLLELADKYKKKLLEVGNKSDGVLAKLFSDFLENYGKGIFLLKDNETTWFDLVCTKSKAGYFEYSSLTDSKNAIKESEIRSVIHATTVKFLDTYPNERHHLQILCSGLNSYEHLIAVYNELLKISENHEEQLSISLGFTCKNRVALDNIYQTICDSFDSSRIDSNMNIRLFDNIEEVDDGEVDLIYSFDPLFAHNKIAVDAPLYIETSKDSLNWEYCASRKIPSDPISNKSQFSLNNHVLDSVAAIFHKSFMFSSGKNINSSFCREVSQLGLKDEISKGLSKCNWLVIYDYLLCKDTLSICNDAAKKEDKTNRRVLRYIQGEGLKRSLSIITDKETHYITKNLKQSLQTWNLVHPEKIPLLVDQIFTRSNSFSSDTLLRSVGNGNFSHDLVGTAGAAALIESVFAEKEKISSIFWVHLDDYLSWFKSSLEDDVFKSIGRTINYISDLLGIYINEDSEGKITFSLIVIESKLTNGSQEQSDKSRKQVKSTTDLIKSMLLSSDNMDFEYWLNKFYEFIIGNFKFVPNKFDFNKLVSLDKSQIQVDLYGISVVFHYENDHVETVCEPMGEFEYLTQLSLSTTETKTVFTSMLETQQNVDLKSPIILKPLKLNRVKEALNDNTRPIINKNTSIADDNSESSIELSKTQLDTRNHVINKENFNTENDESTKKTIDINEERADSTTTNAIAGKVISSLELVRDSIDFLEKSSINKQANLIDIDQIKVKVRKIFGHAKLPSNFSNILITPNSIVVKLHGDVNLTPNKVLNLKSTFLSVVGLSLRQVYPASGVMVLIFDREKRETVFFGELLKSTLDERFKSLSEGFNNKILIGQNEYGDDCVFFQLDGASPHALIGGQTKSGKSILMNNMIIDLLMTNTPDNLHLRLFDPKQVEFAAYSRAPHLAHPVVLDKETAVLRLEELETLMNTRYRRLMELGVKDFEAYNRKYPNDRMSREVVFFDELADWILDNEFKAAAKDIIVRLSSKGRAAGVHLVLATQRPSADVVFPLLRANLDTKIALKVDRDQNSEIILGETGAENLLGYGHGIVKTEGETKTIQVGFTEPLIFDELVEKVIEFWLINYSVK